MKASIPRTANFSWSPASLQVAEPYIATGTVAGALDESFSNESLIEIWQPSYGSGGGADAIKPLGSAATSAKLNRLTWGYVDQNYSKGLLAAGLESGELGVWDAQKIIDGSSESQILRKNTHTGPVRGLDFNPNQPNLLGSGAVNGEIYIWDITNPSKPFSPGARSTKLDEITSLSWNAQVPHILATSSSSGYTVVWDLKNKREVCALAYGGGAGTAVGGVGGATNGLALAAGARRGMGAVAWHPDISTRLATASEDDSSPIIMLWDLRNARAPERIMTGHDKGVLSLSWCKQDPDLLLSCGKDNRTIAWNPQTCEIVGELPPSSNWSFDVQWCPRNPELLATASFDGKVGIHSMQSTNQSEQEGASAVPAAAAADGSDIFNLPSTSETPSQGLTLKQPPKWLRRPVGATFAFGGQLVSVPKQTPGASTSRVVHLRNVVTEPAIVARATRLQEAIESQSLAQFCDERSKEAIVSKPEEVANWKALQTLFQADSRDELVALLGFNKEDVAAKVAQAISAYKSGGSSSLAGLSSTPSTPSAKPASHEAIASILDDTTAPHEPVVSFADQTAVGAVGGDASAAEATPSEVSTISSEFKGTTEGGESEATEPSLFSEDAGANGSLATDQAGLEFFNSISGESGAGVRSAVPERVLVPHMTFPPASSVAATAGSPGPSSVASADLRPTTFRIYPSDESDADKLITRALVLGDFESAVSLCVSTDRFADALLLAVRGGPDLLARTQKTYFERRTISLPYLRLFQSIVSDDLTDIVQNADLNEWQEIFVVLCTFAKAEDFSNLAEQLGQRLEFQYVKTSGQAGSSADSSKLAKAKQHRKNAILCYLAAGKLEKVAGMWIDEMKEEEAAIAAARKSAAASDGSNVNGSSTEPAASSLYSAHAEALQTFIEKITVFQNAVGYVDLDLQQPTTNEEVAASGARTYKLAALYDRIHEYVELLADQGLLTPALKYVNQTPSDYDAPSASSDITSSASVGLHPARERLLQADSARSGGKGAAQTAAPSTSSFVRASIPAPVQQQQAFTSPAAAAPSYGQAYEPYAVTTPVAVSNQVNPYGVPAPAPVQPQQPVQPMQQQQSYGGYVPPMTQYSNAYGAPGPTPQHQLPRQSISMIPSPPPLLDSTPTPYGMPPSQQQVPPSGSLPPPPPKRSEGGWNDIPDLPSAATRRAASAMGQKAAPIMSPFPNSPVPAPATFAQQSPSAPPPRGATPGTRNFASPPPPPPGSGFQQHQQQHRGPPPPRQAPPPQGPPRSGSAAGMRPQPGSGVPPVPSIPQIPSLGGGPGAYGMPPNQQQQQQQVRPSGPYAPPPGQQGGPPSNLSQGPPGAPGGPFGQQVRPPPGSAPSIHRSQTPGAGAGPPRSHTPGAGAGAAGSRPGAPQLKYPPGDRSHIPEPQRIIFGTLSRELTRVKSSAPPAQKRVVDDSERRLNNLFDYLNNGMIPEKVVAGLLELIRAVEARNQQAALALHVQIVSSASGEVAAMLVGVKYLITRLNA